jgi:hypothetical protein
MFRDRRDLVWQAAELAPSIAEGSIRGMMTMECPLSGDTVAKVFLRDVTQILRAVRATIEYVGGHIATC